MPDSAPTPNAQRGPKRSTTQPVSGAPSGVPPITTAIRNASTRPRIVRSVVSCIIELLAVMNVSDARPTRNSITANRYGPGITAATASVTPNPPADTDISTIPGTGRRADNSAPVIVPTAIAEVSRPYWLASPWNSVTDIVEMKIAKL